jgi:hypothetical protein
VTRNHCIVQYAVKESFIIITGNPETKGNAVLFHCLELKELLPGIISQAGPQQYEYLKKFQAEIKTEPVAEAKKEAKKEEDIPDLVATNFEEVSNKK